MTLRKTEIIEWSTTPAELRRIADGLPVWSGPRDIEMSKGVILRVYLDEGQWQAEQAEGKE